MQPPDTDQQFHEVTIAKVESTESGWDVTRSDGWNILVTNEQEKSPPVIGETIRCYGRGIGYTVRGITIGGRVYRYETEAECEAKHQQWCKDYEARQEREKAEFVASLPSRPPLPTFELADQEYWTKTVESNSADPYSYACVKYAANWAALMDTLLEGTTVAAIAKQASHDADTDGITGFMYGAAVSMLSRAWKHGDELRRWHNLDTQIRDEGVLANESEATLNPAMLSIGVSWELPTCPPSSPAHWPTNSRNWTI